MAGVGAGVAAWHRGGRERWLDSSAAGRRARGGALLGVERGGPLPSRLARLVVEEVLPAVVALGRLPRGTVSKVNRAAPPQLTHEGAELPHVEQPVVIGVVPLQQRRRLLLARLEPQLAQRGTQLPVVELAAAVGVEAGEGGAHISVAPRARAAACLEGVGEGERAAVADLVRVERELAQPPTRLACVGPQRARKLLGAAVAHAVAAEPEPLETRRSARQQRRSELGGAVVADLVVVEPELDQVRQPARTHRARDRTRSGVTQPVAAQVKLGEVGRRAPRQRVGEQRAAPVAHRRAEPQHLEPRRATLAQRQGKLGRRGVVHLGEPQLAAPAQPPQRPLQRVEGLSSHAGHHAQQLGAAQVQGQGQAATLLGACARARAASGSHGASTPQARTSRSQGSRGGCGGRGTTATPRTSRSNSPCRTARAARARAPPRRIAAAARAARAARATVMAAAGARVMAVRAAAAG
eukprot:scaffold108454_cov76-Phaeocystis_antarctica.AAC.1